MKMGTLKDALLKAGVKPTVEAKPAKSQNHREKIKKKHVTEEVLHQGQRNYCEACDQVKPDVEFYSHRNPTTDAEWICLRCADQLQIPDTFRKTAQSDTSIRKMFRREFGATISISAQPSKTSDKSRGDINGNR
jgi:hypothetical protein